MKTIITDKIENKEIHLKKDEALTYIAILKNGWKEPKTLTFHLEGENANLTFLAFIIGKGKDKFPFETISNHQAPKTFSRFHIRSVLFDHSSIDCKGKLKIARKAQSADTYLAHHTLILSPNAKVKTLPALEIKANNVKAGHSATIGKIDEDLLFYLQSRGINKKLGQNLLIKSFMETDLKALQI